APRWQSLSSSARCSRSPPAARAAAKMAKVAPVFNKLKKEVLGERYDLSFAFVSEKAMRRAMKFRYAKIAGKKTSNVLSFPLSRVSGEILICKAAAKPYTTQYLFIHGLLHLKGRVHGATMEREEAKLLKKFGLRAQ